MTATVSIQTVDKGYGKVRALREGSFDLAPGRICATGDEINDMAMISQAGLGIAMGNAAPSIKAAAKRETLHHDDDGVAHAIKMVLDGEW